MSKKVYVLFAVIALVIVVSSCGTKRDCQGRKKSYNKEGGFWM
jgi:hypothetical protein